MQPVNGVDQGHPTAELSEPIENSGEPIELSEDLKKKLREPLPAEAVSPNPQKPGLSAIKVIYVVERLNDVFGLNGWHMDNEVVEAGRMVVVRATLAIPKYGIAIEQFGGNDNPDRGDAYKGACTDALSKCASYLGIGMEVYKGLTDNRPRDGGGSRHGVRAPVCSPAREGRTNRTAARNDAAKGLTNRNMAARFGSMRCVLGAQAYEEILGRHGYQEVTNIPNLEKAREVYTTLLDAFRLRFGEAQRKIGNAEYAKILGELRFNPNARLNPDQAVRVFNHMLKLSMPENEHGKSSGRLCERIYGCIRTLRGVIHMAKKQPPFKTKAQEAPCWAKSQNLIADRFEQAKAAGKLGKGTVARVARERAGARLRGIEAKRKLLETEGDPLSSAQAAKLLKISRQGVDKRRRENKLLGLELGKKGYHYPSWQLDLRGLEQVLTALGRARSMGKAQFLSQP